MSKKHKKQTGRPARELPKLQTTPETLAKVLLKQRPLKDVEKYRPVKLRPDIVLRLNTLAREQNQNVDQLANNLLNTALAQI